MLRQSSNEQRFLLHHIYSFNIVWRVLQETRCSPHTQMYIYVSIGNLSTLTIWVNLERIVSQPDGHVMDDIWANKTGKEKKLFVLEPFLTCGSSCNKKRKRRTNLFITPLDPTLTFLHLFETWTWLTTPTSSYPMSDQWPCWRRRSRNVLIPQVVSLIPLITINEQSKIADATQKSCTGAYCSS